MKTFLTLITILLLSSCSRTYNFKTEYYGTRATKMRMINESDLEIVQCNNTSKPEEVCFLIGVCSTLFIYDENKIKFDSSRFLIDYEHPYLYPNHCLTDTIDIISTLKNAFNIIDGTYFFGSKEFGKEVIGPIPFKYSKIRDFRSKKSFEVFLSNDTLIGNRVSVTLKNDTQYELKSKYINAKLILGCGNVEKKFRLDKLKHGKQRFLANDSLEITFDIPRSIVNQFKQNYCDEPDIYYVLYSEKYPIELHQHHSPLKNKINYWYRSKADLRKLVKLKQ